MTPEPPLLTGNLDEDMPNLWYYIMEVASYVDSEPDVGWSNVGTAPLRTISAGMSLADLTNVVATLAGVMIQKGLLSNEVP